MSNENVPILNHVTMTVSKDILAGENRDKLRKFCTDVLGWSEMANLTEDGKHLVFRIHKRGHFMNLIVGNTRVIKGHNDHMGLEVRSRAELEAINAKAKKFKESVDSTLDVEEIHTSGSVDTTEQPPRRAWSFYLTYMVPMRIEYQWHEAMK